MCANEKKMHDNEKKNFFVTSARNRILYTEGKKKSRKVDSHSQLRAMQHVQTTNQPLQQQPRLGYGF